MAEHRCKVDLRRVFDVDGTIEDTMYEAALAARISSSAFASLQQVVRHAMGRTLTTKAPRWLVQKSVEIRNPISRDEQLNASRSSWNFPNKASLFQFLDHAMTGWWSSLKVLLKIGLCWRFPVYLCVVVDER